MGFWGGAVPGNVGDLRGLHDAGVFGFKCFMVDSGVEEFPPLSADQLEDTSGVLASLRRDDDRARRGRRRPIERAPAPHGRRYADFLASRPRGSENVAIAHVIEAARHTGASRAHAAPVQLRRRADAPHARAARASG